MGRGKRVRRVLAVVCLTGISATATAAPAGGASITWGEAPDSITWVKPQSITWGEAPDSITWGEAPDSITW